MHLRVGCSRIVSRAAHSNINTVNTVNTVNANNTISKSRKRPKDTERGHVQ